MRFFMILFALYPVTRLLADHRALNDGNQGAMPVGGINGPKALSR